MNKKATAYIGVGSNINPEENIIKAFHLLKNKVQITGISTFYRTSPVGRIHQAEYLNGVWRIETDLSPEKLKSDVLKKIEDKLKRIRSEDKFISRTIDLDLILFDELIIQNDKLKIPDSDIYERDFIAVPLWELDPELVIPDSKEKIKDIIKKFNLDSLKPEKKFSYKIKEVLKNYRLINC